MLAPANLDFVAQDYLKRSITFKKEVGKKKKKGGPKRTFLDILKWLADPVHKGQSCLNWIRHGSK